MLVAAGAGAGPRNLAPCIFTGEVVKFLVSDAICPGLAQYSVPDYMLDVKQFHVVILHARQYSGIIIVLI